MPQRPRGPRPLSAPQRALRYKLEMKFLNKSRFWTPGPSKGGPGKSPVPHSPLLATRPNPFPGRPENHVWLIRVATGPPSRSRGCPEASSESEHSIGNSSPNTQDNSQPEGQHVQELAAHPGLAPGPSTRALSPSSRVRASCLPPTTSLPGPTAQLPRATPGPLRMPPCPLLRMFLQTPSGETHTQVPSGSGMQGSRALGQGEATGAPRPSPHPCPCSQMTSSHTSSPSRP